LTLARFILLTPILNGPTKLPSGTTVADTIGNAIGNDVVWPKLFTALPLPGAVAPLDISAQALLPGSPPIYPAAYYFNNISFFGAGLDAGR
jgi:hypothetical protein